MIRLHNLSKIYKTKSGEVQALRNVNLDLPERGMIFVLGKSGSGKSTLLNLIGGLDNFTSGDLTIDGVSMFNYKATDFNSYRNLYIGFIFQEFNLIESFQVGKNISLALELQKVDNKRTIIEEALRQVGLEGYFNRKISELSGGQKQRVAIARAVVKNPKIILADEPTGNLDSSTAKEIFDLLKKMSKDRLVLVVSHDKESAVKYAERIIELRDGMVYSESKLTAYKSTDGVGFVAKKDTHIASELKKTKFFGNMSFVSLLSYAFTNLRLKKVRVAASILLFILSLSFFNFAFSASRYDVYDTTIKTFQDAGYNYANLNSYNAKQKFNYIDTEFKEEAVPIYGNCNFIIDNYGAFELEINKKERGFYNDTILSSMPIDHSILKNMGFTVLYGRLPENSTEVCLTKYNAEGILYIGKEYWDSLGIFSIEGLVNQIKDRSGLFNVVGIIDTKFDPKYDELRGSTSDEIGLMTNGLAVSFQEQTNATSHVSLLCHESYFADIYLPNQDLFYYDSIGLIPHENKLEGYSFDTLEIMGYDYHKVSDLNNGVVLPYNSAREFIKSAGLGDELLNYNYENIVELLASHEIKAKMKYGKTDSYSFSDRIIGVYDDNHESNHIFLSGSSKTQLMDNVMCLKSLLIDMDNQDAIKRAIQLSGLVQKESAFRFNNDVIDEIEQTRQYALLFQTIGGAAAGIFALIVVLLLLNYFMSIIKDKNKEIGILRALGVKNSNVMSIYFFEALIISLMSFLISLPVGFVLRNWLETLVMNSLSQGYDVFVHFIDMGLIFCLISFALCVGVALISCVVPFVKLFRYKPMEIMRRQ